MHNQLISESLSNNNELNIQIKQALHKLSNIFNKMYFDNVFIQIRKVYKKDYLLELNVVTEDNEVGTLPETFSTFSKLVHDYNKALLGLSLNLCPAADHQQKTHLLDCIARLSFELEYGRSKKYLTDF
ncbi:hypothetical protein ACSTIN_12845 [Vibrio parahaemolyticus]